MNSKRSPCCFTSREKMSVSVNWYLILISFIKLRYTTRKHSDRSFVCIILHKRQGRSKKAKRRCFQRFERAVWKIRRQITLKLMKVSAIPTHVRPRPVAGSIKLINYTYENTKQPKTPNLCLIGTRYNKLIPQLLLLLHNLQCDKQKFFVLLERTVLPNENHKFSSN